MIQRVQTLLLLAASAIIFSMFFGTLASTSSESIRYTSVSALLILNIVSFGMAFFSIFLYRHRLLQIRVTVFNMVVLTGYQGWIVYLFINRPQESIFTVSAVFPVIAAILSFLAMRYIARDEAMIRSASRLRK